MNVIASDERSKEDGEQKMAVIARCEPLGFPSFQRSATMNSRTVPGRDGNGPTFRAE